MATRKSTASASAPHGIPAVAYIRMSGDKQDASPGQQRDAVAKLAVKHGFTITREYTDLAISGDATDKRVGFQKMIQDAAKGGFKAILCWDQDRFGRFNSIEAGFWIHPLMQAGIELITVAQGRIDWNDFTGRLMYTITQEGKHSFLKDLARNCLRGKLEAAKRGEWLGMVPMGYVKVDRKLEVEPVGAGIVRRIFELYVGGLSLRGIAEQFTREGIRSASGKAWGYTAVKNTLDNPVYVGTYRYNWSHSGKYAGIRGGGVETDVAKGVNDSADWIVFENHHEALIDAATFHAAQRMLADRKCKTTPIRNGGDFYLTGLMKCGYCGSAMAGRKARDGRIQYLCAGFQHGGEAKCAANRVHQQAVADAVLTTIERQFLEPRNLAKLRAELKRQIDRQTDGSTVERLRKELDAVETRIGKASKRLMECDADMLATVQEGLRELRAERDRLEAALKAAGTPRKTLAAEAEQKVRRATEAVSGLRGAFQDDPLRMRELLRSAVDRIDVWSEREREGDRTSRWLLRRGSLFLKGGFVSDLFTPAGPYRGRRPR